MKYSEERNSRWRKEFSKRSANALQGECISEHHVNFRELRMIQAINLVLSTVVDEQKTKARACWLDAGCGTCWTARWFSAQGFEFHNMDYCLEQLTLAKNRYFPGGQNFVAGNMLALPFREKCFDVITALSVLALFDDVEGILRSFHSLLRPKGMIAVELLNKQSLYYYATYFASFFLRKRFKHLRERDSEVFRYTERTISSILERLGEPYSIYRVFCMPPLPRSIDSWLATERMQRLISKIPIMRNFFNHAFIVTIHKKS